MMKRNTCTLHVMHADGAHSVINYVGACVTLISLTSFTTSRVRGLVGAMRSREPFDTACEDVDDFCVGVGVAALCDADFVDVDFDEGAAA